MLNPDVVYIETTNHCNANCIMCPHDKMTRKKGFMSDQIFRKVVEDCKELNLEKLEIFLHKEGEPLLDNKLVDRIKYIKEELPEIKNLAINTNAMLLDKVTSRKILSSNSLDTIYFSVDGVSPQSYNKIRLQLDYETVYKNLQDFFLIKEEINSDIYVIMQMLVYDDNKHEIDEYRKLWEKKANELFFKKMHSYLDGWEISLIDSKKQLRSCKDPSRLIVIYWDGNAGICCWDYDNQARVGSVNESSIIEIFNNKKFNDIRKSHKNLDCKSLVPCNRCMRIYGQEGIYSYFNLDEEII